MADNKLYFGKVARQWDEMRKSFFSDSVRERVYLVAGIKAGIHVIAADQSEKMLEMMKKSSQVTILLNTGKNNDFF
jgi:hypothetical protein